MRAVKSVLVMAGSLKRENPEIVEDVTLIRALRDSNLPKFLTQDAILFKATKSQNTITVNSYRSSKSVPPSVNSKSFKLNQQKLFNFMKQWLSVMVLCWLVQLVVQLPI